MGSPSIVGVALEDSAAGQPLEVSLGIPPDVTCGPVAGNLPTDFISPCIKPLLVPNWEPNHLAQIDDVVYGESPLQALRPKLQLGFIKPVNPYDISEHCIALKQVADCLGEVADAIPEPPSSESGIFNVEMGGHIIKYKPTQVNYNHEYNGEKTVDIKGIVVDHGNTL